MHLKVSRDNLFYGAGVAAVWGVSASAIQHLIRNELQASPGSAGLLAPSQIWPLWAPWPSTILGALVFAIVAALFVRVAAGGEHRSPRLVLASMLVGTGVLWGFAIARGATLSQGISAVSLVSLVRYATPLSMSATAAAVVGAVIGLIAVRRTAASRGTSAAGV